MSLDPKNVNVFDYTLEEGVDMPRAVVEFFYLDYSLSARLNACGPLAR